MEVVNPETEKTIIVKLGSKSVRMDVLFEGENEWYNLEMQVANIFSPRKRSRYYHSIKNVDSLQRGQSYEDLKPGYVIFICMFDLFGMNKAMYHFEMFDSKNNLPLEDGQVTIFLNATCTGEIPDELSAFYRYLQNGEVEESDELICKMDRAVEDIIQREEVRSKVTFYDDMVRLKGMYDAAMKELEEVRANVERTKEQAEAERAKANEECAKAEAERVKAEAAERLNRLMNALIAEKRFADLEKMQTDEAYREGLFSEFQL